VHDYYFNCIAIKMQRVLTTATHIVTLNSSGFWRILNGKYDSVIIDVHARTELYFFFHKSLFGELKIYHIVCIL